MATPVLMGGAASASRGSVLWAGMVLRWASGRASERRKLPKRRGEYLFGVAPCLAALSMNRRKVHAILLREGMAGQRDSLRQTMLVEVRRYSEQRRVELHYVDKESLERLLGKRPHQGILVDAQPLSFKPMKLEDSKKLYAVDDRQPIWLALDEIQDPMNFGAILRCAYFLGVDKVIATSKNRAAAVSLPS